MALIRCPECGKEVSDQAQQCIQCGYPLTPADQAGNLYGNEMPDGPPYQEEKKSNLGFWGIVGAVIVGLIIASLL